MKVIFYVQGEGRGHLTQAIAIAEKLKAMGHDVITVGVGKPSKREIPTYVKDYFERHFFVYKTLEIFYTKGRKLHKARTFFTCLWRGIYYFKSLRNIRRRWKHQKPDLIINFFEPLAGMAIRLSKPPCPVLSISHQNLFLGETDYALKGRWLDHLATVLLAKLSAGRAKLIALSLTDMPVHPAITVSPPLLRSQVDLQAVSRENFALVYLLNTGYMDDIKRLSDRYPDLGFKVFVAHNDPSPVVRYGDKVEFHRIDGIKFLDCMQRCRCVIATAGFETVAEAAWLGKPIGVVPVEGHYEQNCNAQDVERCGLGIMRHDFEFDMDALCEFDNTDAVTTYREWLSRSDQIFIDALSEFYSEAELKGIAI